MSTNSVATRPSRGQIHDRDGVIREAAFAASHGAKGVHRALGAFLAATPDETEHAEQRLRDELVAQAIGFEVTAADGATRRLRVIASQMAIALWDGRRVVYGDDEDGLSIVAADPTSAEEIIVLAARKFYEVLEHEGVPVKGAKLRRPHADALLSLCVGMQDARRAEAIR